jgi:signal transduction histidine kinase
VSLTGTRRSAHAAEIGQADGELSTSAATSSAPEAEGRTAFRGIERAGVRQRSVAVAMVVVMAALAAGGGLLIILLQLNLRDTALSAASARAAEVALLGQTQGLTETARTIQEESRSGQFVQIITADGRVVAASNKLVATRPMSRQLPAVGQVQEVLLDIDSLGQSGDWIVVARGAEIGGAPYVIQVALPTETQQQTVQTVAWFLLGAAPILIALAALAVWMLVGRALRPVERIRATVSTIDAQRLAQRVKVPPSRDEIAALAATMNVMLDRLEAADLALRSFVSDANHELRSPLAAMTTAVEIAVDADEATRTELLETMSRELARMRALVDDLMTLAQADAQRLVTDWTDVDLDDLLNLEVRRLRSTSRREVVARFSPVRVRGDVRRLAQVLRNVIDNAERHASTTVRLNLAVEDGAAVLRVDNDGPPIPPADRNRIFERFVRLENSRSRDAGGTGLGLAISREIVSAHGGVITVAEERNGWCRFEIRLPAVVAA